MDGGRADHQRRGAARRAACAPSPRAPRAGALLCDIDGTISPIVPRPADAAVPAETREVLAALAERLGLVAFVTGRALEDGRRMIPLDGAAYVGTHGLELMTPTAPVQTEPQAERYVAQVARGRRARGARPRLRGARHRPREQAHRARRPLPAGARRGGDPARDPHQGRRAGARPRGWRSRRGTSSSRCGRRCRSPRARPTRRLLAAGAYMSGPVLRRRPHRRHRLRSRPRVGRAATRGARPAPWPRSPTRRRGRSSKAADVLVRATPGVHEALRRLLAAVGG